MVTNLPILFSIFFLFSYHSPLKSKKKKKKKIMATRAALKSSNFEFPPQEASEVPAMITEPVYAAPSADPTFKPSILVHKASPLALVAELLEHGYFPFMSEKKSVVSPEASNLEHTLSAVHSKLFAKMKHALVGNEPSGKGTVTVDDVSKVPVYEAADDNLVACSAEVMAAAFFYLNVMKTHPFTEALELLDIATLPFPCMIDVQKMFMIDDGGSFIELNHQRVLNILIERFFYDRCPPASVTNDVFMKTDSIALSTLLIHAELNNLNTQRLINSDTVVSCGDSTYIRIPYTTFQVEFLFPWFMDFCKTFHQTGDDIV